MLIKITDPITQTTFFASIFLLLLIFSVRKSQSKNYFSKNMTNQLKGFAILTIIFSHIGYFLSSDPKFLYPLSILAGVGVNLFLFLSGFGLTLSHLNSPLSPLAFYRKRLLKLFVSVWIVVAMLLLADYLVFRKSYPLVDIIHNFLGFYPKADLFQNLNSPLWYFSIILFYYLIFPLFFIKKIPLASPFLILAFSIILLNLPLPVDPDVLKLYKLHFLAFPIGMLFGLIIQKVKFRLNIILKILIFIVTLAIFLYTAVNSGVGQDPKIEQGISLITTVSVIVIFSLSWFDFKLLSLFGIYSYEIYLLHWPIFSRYDIFPELPPFLIVVSNIILIFILGYALQKITAKVIRYLNYFINFINSRIKRWVQSLICKFSKIAVR